MLAVVRSEWGDCCKPVYRSVGRGGIRNADSEEPVKIAMGYVGWALFGIVLSTSNWPTPTLETAIFKFCPLFIIGGMLVIVAMLAMSKSAHETGTLQSAKADGPGYGSAKESANINGKECE
jgi:hypothetical protein